MFVLDTNVLISFVNDESGSVRRRSRRAAATGATLAVSAIAYHELAFGAAKSTRRPTTLEYVEGLLGPELHFLDFDREDARIAGDIRAILQKRGTPIGPYDVLIAAQALRRGATLVTANAREFARIDGLAWEDWSA